MPDNVREIDGRHWVALDQFVGMTMLARNIAIAAMGEGVVIIGLVAWIVFR